MEDCECKNWCQDGRDMYATHHYNCQHYTPPPTDPRFARFGKAMWEYIDRLGGDFCGEEISEDILPLAAEAGLCCRIPYDPELHGDGIDAEPGEEIWFWGDWNLFFAERQRPCNPARRKDMTTGNDEIEGGGCPRHLVLRLRITNNRRNEQNI